MKRQWNMGINCDTHSDYFSGVKTHKNHSYKNTNNPTVWMEVNSGVNISISYITQSLPR